MSAGVRRRAAVGLVVGFAAVAVGLVPARSQLADAAGSVEQHRSQAVSLESRLVLLRPLAQEVTELEVRRERLDALVPPAADVSGFVTELHAIAGREGVDLRDVVPSPALDSTTDAATPPGWSSIVVGLRIRGTYAEVARFVDALSSASRLAVIDRVAMVADSGSGLLADFDVRVFTNTDPLAQAVGVELSRESS